MQHIKNKFTAGIFYSEMEINQIIKASITFDDYVLIKRELIEKHYLRIIPLLVFCIILRSLFSRY